MQAIRASLRHRSAPRATALVVLSFILGACAPHPPKPLPGPVPPPVPTADELDSARAGVRQCLHVEAYKLDDGVSAPADLGYAVSCGCLDQLHDLGVLESRRTRDATAAWVVYMSTMRSATARGTQAVVELRRAENFAGARR